MKNTWLMVGACAFFMGGFCMDSSLKAQQHSSFKPGQEWSDAQGNHINAHGGGILFYNDTYYWYGEHKSSNTSSALVGINCYSSTDLYNWIPQGVALKVEADSTHDLAKGCVMERPKVIYNPTTKKFLMWFHLELKGQGYNAARVAIAESDNPTGPFRYIKSKRPLKGVWPLNMSTAQIEDNPDTQSIEKWWTPLWREAVENGLFVRRDFSGGQMSRDMTLFVDTDSTAYHIYSSEENLTLHIAELTPDYKDYTGKYVRIFPGGHNEAPAIFKKDSMYYLITSGCTGWDPNAARLFSAKHILGPWTAHANPCRGEDAELTFHSQSTFILPIEGKADQFIFMADRWMPKTPDKATYIWLPIEFENDLPVLKWKSEWCYE